MADSTELVVIQRFNQINDGILALERVVVQRLEHT